MWDRITKDPSKCFVHLKSMKTGSTTIDRFFTKNNIKLLNDHPGMRHFCPRHSAFAILELVMHSRFGEDFFNQLNFITAVREPVARAESWCAHQMHPRMEANDFVRDTFLKIPNDEEFLNGGNVPNLQVVKTETLTADLKRLAKANGWPVHEVPRANTLKPTPTAARPAVSRPTVEMRATAPVLTFYALAGKREPRKCTTSILLTKPKISLGRDSNGLSITITHKPYNHDHGNTHNSLC